MNKKLGMLSVLLCAFAGTVQAATQTIDFGATGSTFFVTDYVDVSYLDVPSRAHYGTGSGYESVMNAASSDQYVAFNPFATSPSSFASASGELFNLDSFWLAGAWGSQTLTITGYANGVEISSAAVGVDITAKQYFFPSFQGIDTFTIAIGNDFVRDPSAVDTGQHWALDGVTVTTIPEPETWGMLLAGLGVMGSVMRRRRTRRAI